MGMSYGSENSGGVSLSGMSDDIFETMDRLLSPPLQEAIDSASPDTKEGAETALLEARKGWEKLSYAISKGVVDHIRSNMEIEGIQARGNVAININGNTSLESDHTHSVNLSDTDMPTLDQVPGTGGVV